MSHTIIALDVYCEEKAEIHPVYRVLLDNQLVIERPFWPAREEFFIQEQLTMENDGNPHSLSVVNVFEEFGKIKVKKVKFLNGDDKTVIKLSSQTDSQGAVKFTLPKR